MSYYFQVKNIIYIQGEQQIKRNRCSHHRWHVSEQKQTNIKTPSHTLALSQTNKIDGNEIPPHNHNQFPLHSSKIFFSSSLPYVKLILYTSHTPQLKWRPLITSNQKLYCEKINLHKLFFSSTLSFIIFFFCLCFIVYILLHNHHNNNEKDNGIEKHYDY